MGEVELWLLFTAILFTFVGMRMSTNNRDKVIAETIDFLIAEGYLETETLNDGTVEVKKLNK